MEDSPSNALWVGYMAPNCRYPLQTVSCHPPLPHSETIQLFVRCIYREQQLVPL